MPHFPVRESHRLAALFVDPREHAVVGRALHMLLDDVEHRAQAIILWQYILIGCVRVNVLVLAALYHVLGVKVRVGIGFGWT